MRCSPVSKARSTARASGAATDGATPASSSVRPTSSSRLRPNSWAAAAFAYVGRSARSKRTIGAGACSTIASITWRPCASVSGPGMGAEGTWWRRALPQWGPRRARAAVARAIASRAPARFVEGYGLRREVAARSVGASVK